MGFDGGDPNLYQFAASNPANHTDPSGCFWLQIAGAVVGAVHGGVTAWINGGGFGSILVGVGVGAAVGAVDPVGTFVSAGTAAVGGVIGYAAGGADGAALGYNVGSLVGGFGGAVGQSAYNQGLQAGLRTATYMGVGAGLGAGTFAVAGWDPLVGANLGMALGGITKGIVDWRRAANAARTPPAANRADFEELKAELRRQMSKPAVKEADLAAHLDELYRAGAKVGSGSTAAAIRQELATGVSVGGVFHSQKGTDSIKFLERWLKNNPNASRADRAAAENVLLDLKDALGP
jgi:hypothetical protein